MSRWRESHPRGVGSALLVIAAVAAASPACSTGRPEGPALDHVRAIVMPYLTLMPFYIAQELGYFEQQGLDVEFVRVGRSQEVMTALAIGEADVAGGMITINELNLAASGVALRLVVALGDLNPENCPTAAFIVRRELLESGALEDPERIRGLRFDTDELTILGYWTELLVRPFGLTFDHLHTTSIPSPAALETLAEGLIDVTVDSEPWLTLHQNRGVGTVWKQAGELIPGFTLSLIAYGPTLVQERPEVGKRFAVAMLQAIRDFTAGASPRNRDLVERTMGLPRELLPSVCWPSVKEGARLDPEVFRGYQEWSVERGLVERVLEDDELFDHRFIDHANAVLAR